MGHFSCSDLDASLQRNRRSHDAARGSAERTKLAHNEGEPPLHERVVESLSGAGFPGLVIEHGQVALSGFIIMIEPDGNVRVNWIGAREVNSLPYRRTFLGAYASTLRQAGLGVTYVENAGEPYLICGSSPPPA